MKRGAATADMSLTRFSFGYASCLYAFASICTSLGKGINMTAGGIVAIGMIGLFNALNIRQFLHNRDYRKSDKFLLACVIATLSIIVAMTVMSRNSIANMVLLIAVLAFCNYITALFHMSAMIVCSTPAAKPNTKRG